MLSCAATQWWEMQDGIASILDLRVYQTRMVQVNDPMSLTRWFSEAQEPEGIIFSDIEKPWAYGLLKNMACESYMWLFHLECVSHAWVV